LNLLPPGFLRQQVQGGAPTARLRQERENPTWRWHHLPAFFVCPGRRTNGTSGTSWNKTQ
jgi:hypothetical protein